MYGHKYRSCKSSRYGFKLLLGDLALCIQLCEKLLCLVGCDLSALCLCHFDKLLNRLCGLELNKQFLDVDAVVISIGTSPNPLIKATTKGLDTQKWGGIIADENGLTSREGVYAGGDAVTGAATVILAMGAGKTAAAAIDEYIRNKNK